MPPKPSMKSQKEPAKFALLLQGCMPASTFVVEGSWNPQRLTFDKICGLLPTEEGRIMSFGHVLYWDPSRNQYSTTQRLRSQIPQLSESCILDSSVRYTVLGPRVLGFGARHGRCHDLYLWCLLP